MKKVYIPTMDELYLMQDIINGYQMYQYLLVKVIEKLIIDGKNNKDKAALRNVQKYLREHERIAYAICRMYPEEIKYSEIAQNDTNLCQELITNNPERSIYSLDNLSYFENSMGMFSNASILKTTTELLSEKLFESPQYRFEYKQNSLLDSIFQRKITNTDIYWHKEIIIDGLMKIEPAYALTLDIEKIAREKNISSEELLIKYLNYYISRYRINPSTGAEYYGKDILTNPDTEVKRLLKFINRK